MDEFIQMVTKPLGVSDETGKSATGGNLQMLQDQLGSDVFASIAAKLPDLLGKK